MYGPLCEPCVLRRAVSAGRRATFAHLSASTFGFARYEEEDPYD